MLSSAGFSFGDLQTLILDIRVDSHNTLIPSPVQLSKVYSDRVPPSAIDQLDTGKVNIGITLTGENHTRAAIIIEIDQTALSDQWLRVTVPAKAMQSYREINYQRTAIEPGQFANTTINGISIVAETKSGSVLRHNIENWNASVPEVFKEIRLSLKKVALQLKSATLQRKIPK